MLKNGQAAGQVVLACKKKGQIVGWPILNSGPKKSGLGQAKTDGFKLGQRISTYLPKRMGSGWVSEFQLILPCLTQNW